jgi:hypothetical protein
VEKVVPAIKEKKWPDQGRRIVIQQDGASSHIEDNDAAFEAVASRTSLWNISLVGKVARFECLRLVIFSCTSIASVEIRIFEHNGGVNCTSAKSIRRV